MNAEQRTIDWLLMRVAGAGITSSTTRGQGPSGTMDAAVKFLYSPKLIGAFNEANSVASFSDVLDDKTEELRKALPSPCTRKDGDINGGYWGSARKFLNIFLLDCVLNRCLCDCYNNLITIEPWLEVPLDGYVGMGLTSEKENLDPICLLKWRTIIGLKKQDSDSFQCLAQRVANRMHIPRAHLDLLYLAYKKDVPRQ